MKFILDIFLDIKKATVCFWWRFCVFHTASCTVTPPHPLFKLPPPAPSPTLFAGWESSLFLICRQDVIFVTSHRITHIYIYIVVLFRVNILGTKRSQNLYINTICRSFTTRSSDRTFFFLLGRRGSNTQTDGFSLSYPQVSGWALSHIQDLYVHTVVEHLESHEERTQRDHDGASSFWGPSPANSFKIGTHAPQLVPARHCKLG
jgi:hypothetical protein